jgi:hypothetical protein
MESPRRTFDSREIESAKKLISDAVVAGFTEGAQVAKDAITEALSSENIAAGMGDMIANKIQEGLAATSIEMRGNLGPVEVELTGPGAVGDIANQTKDSIRGTIAGALNSMFNVDGSQKSPDTHQPRIPYV